VRAAGAHPSEAWVIPFAIAPPSLPTSPLSGGPSPQGTPAALPSPILRRPVPAPAHLAQHGGASRGAQGFPGRRWSRARRPGGWPDGECDVRGAMVCLAFSPLRGQQKAQRGPSPLCRDCRVRCSGCVPGVRLDQGSSCSCVWCCDRTIVYRRHAISGREQTSSQFWWCTAIALSYHDRSCITYMDPPALQGQCCLMALSIHGKSLTDRLPREAI